MSGDQTRYLCRTCGIEFSDGSWILADSGGRLGGRPWTVEDGCHQCRNAVEKVTFRPSVPGLDIPDAIRAGSPAPLPQRVEATETIAPLTVRADDHYGRNDVLAPGESRQPPPPPITAPDFWQWI